MAEDASAPAASDLDQLDLRADCGRCVGLCCVAPAFAASADFAIDKPAGHACPHLGEHFDCTIHSQLLDRGFRGCAVFDCFGAGQKTVHILQRELRQPGTSALSPDWRQDRATAQTMFDSFAVLRQLHELLWYLSAALTYPAARTLHVDLRRLLEVTRQLSSEPPQALTRLDLRAHQALVDDLLSQVSALVRTEPQHARPGHRPGPRRGPNLRRADLIGKDLRRRNLRRADLRGAYLLGSDLRGADLGLADLIGADLRGADVRGADLSRALFVTQMQVNAARGDAHTRLPGSVRRPAHWAGTPTGPAPVED